MIDRDQLLTAARLVDDIDAQRRREQDAFAQGFRIGFGHGYDVGRGTAEHEMAEAWVALARKVRAMGRPGSLWAPTHAELVRRRSA